VTVTAVHNICIALLLPNAVPTPLFFAASEFFAERLIRLESISLGHKVTAAASIRVDADAQSGPIDVVPIARWCAYESNPTIHWSNNG
jgi:hypothetical protein